MSWKMKKMKYLKFKEKEELKRCSDPNWGCKPTKLILKFQKNSVIWVSQLEKFWYMPRIKMIRFDFSLNEDGLSEIFNISENFDINNIFASSLKNLNTSPASCSIRFGESITIIHKGKARKLKNWKMFGLILYSSSKTLQIKTIPELSMHSFPDLIQFDNESLIWLKLKTFTWYDFIIEKEPKHHKKREEFTNKIKKISKNDSWFYFIEEKRKLSFEIESKILWSEISLLNNWKKVKIKASDFSEINSDILFLNYLPADFNFELDLTFRPDFFASEEILEILCKFKKIKILYWGNLIEIWNESNENDFKIEEWFFGVQDKECQMKLLNYEQFVKKL